VYRPSDQRTSCPRVLVLVLQNGFGYYITVHLALETISNCGLSFGCWFRGLPSWFCSMSSLDRTAETCAGRVGGRRRNDVVASLHFATISRRRLDYDERQRLVATDRNSRPSSSSSSRFIAIPDHDTSAAANSAMNRPPTDCRSFAPPRDICSP